MNTPRRLQERGLAALPLFFSLLFCDPPASAVGPYHPEEETVMDRGTTLQWQRGDDGVARSWPEAIGYCDRLVLAGHHDWRLPHIRELKSIVDLGRYAPAADQAFTCQSSPYWSATTVAVHQPAKMAWTVFFGSGDDGWDEKDRAHLVRCVRGGLSEE